MGNYIFAGLQTRNYTAVLVGCVAAALLALLLDGLVKALEDGVRTRQRRRVTIALAVLAALYGYTGLSLASTSLLRGDAPITIGAKTFTEQYILSAMLGQWVEQETGRPTTVVQSLGSMVAFDALSAEDIDIYVDYSGTLWANEMGRDTVPTDRADVLRDVTDFLREVHNIRLVSTLGFENAYALATREQDAEALGLRRVSDLTLHAPRLSIGSDYEFFARPSGPRFETPTGCDSLASAAWIRH